MNYNISTYSMLGRWCRRYSWRVAVVLLIIAICALVGGIAAIFYGTAEQQKTLFKIAKLLGGGGTALGTIQTFWKEISGKFALIRLHQTRGHIVICGLGNKGMRLIDEYMNDQKKRWRVVLIESRKDQPDINGYRARGVTVIIGDASDHVILEEANIVCAKYMYAVTGQDYTNIEATRQAEQLVRKSVGEKSELRCFTHIASPSLKEIFTVHDLFIKADDRFDASIFNVYESAARVLFEKYPPDRYARQLGITGDTLRITIIGFGRMGEQVLKQAARIGHYMEWKNLEVSILDKNLKPTSEKFLAIHGDSNFPAEFVVQDVKLRFIDRDPESLSSFSEIIGSNNQFPSIVYIAVDDDSLGLSLSKHLRSLLKSDEVPIVVCMKSLLSELIPINSPVESNVHGFNILGIGCGFQVLHDEVMDVLARNIHRAYTGGKPWDELDETMRDANRWPADHVSVKLRALQYDDNADAAFTTIHNQEDATEILSELENRRWKAERLMSGWRYAPVTDKARKVHCLLNDNPYHELSEDEKNKDRDMVKNLKNLVESNAWSTYRAFINDV